MPKEKEKNSTSSNKTPTSTKTTKGKSTPSTTKKTEVFPESAKSLMHLWDPHIESFNFFLGDGLKRAVESLETMVVEINGNILKCISFISLFLSFFLSLFV